MNFGLFSNAVQLHHLCSGKW